MQNSCYPVIKWVGGKRQLLDQIKDRMPAHYNRYFEPFFGGGALFFHLAPETAIINDFNSQLINMYSQIKSNLTSFINLIDRYQLQYNILSTTQEKANYYYNIRSLYNDNIKKNNMSIESAAQFIFLNKSGFNGLYRVNKKGEYNVPCAKRDKLNLYDPENIKKVSNLLSKATLLCVDFETACQDAKKDDFVFFDSPYFDTFDTYQSGGFSENDHIRLAALFRRLTDKGVKCMLTNSNTDFVKNLYADYEIDVVGVKRMVNRDSNNRVGQEIIVRNY